MFNKLHLLCCIAICLTHAIDAHDIRSEQAPLREWHLRNHRHLHASFLMVRHDSVFLETAKGQIKAMPIEQFSTADQQWLTAKIASITQLNQPVVEAKTPHNQPVSPPVTSAGFWLLLFLSVVTGCALLIVLLRQRLTWRSKQVKWAAMTVLPIGAVLLLAFTTDLGKRLLGTDPAFVDSAFQPFKPNVATHWDNTWFYVESKGIPTTHSMMTGITKWQQQVPIPQCYIGSNAWQIPLNPIVADTPVPVNQQHFLRGAVAIAANGVPIFNPYTNTGVDALLDGQLDQWGGHSGRADDYHYHIAPLHLDPQTPEVLPIAFALDGYAVYGALEPNGSAMLPLDANHGHFDAAGAYHYHGTPAAPYMIGNMVGKVTEDNTLQLIPQPKAKPVRPSLTPLNGAAITDFQPTGPNGYKLTYTRNGGTYTVDYSWTNSGVYTYVFSGPDGTTTEVYNGTAPCDIPVSTANLNLPLTQVTLFPNPTSGHFELKINGLQPGMLQQVTVYDLNGKQVVSTTDPAQLPRLAKGIYFVKLTFEKGQISRKLVVQ